MSTIKVDTIQTKDGTGNITLSNQLELKNSGTSFGQLTLTDTNNLSIGCTSTDHVGITFGNTYLPRLNESNNDGGVDIGAPSFRYKDIYLAGKVVVAASGSGIDFGATSNAAGKTSELLDDYEEGTWTPAAVGFSGSITFSDAVYVKIGKMVFYSFYMTGKTDVADTDHMAISGLPFEVYAQHPASVGMNTVNFGHAMVNTAETIYFYLPSGGDFQYNNLPHTSGYARVQGAYRTTG